MQLYATDWQLKNAYTNYKIDKPFNEFYFNMITAARKIDKTKQSSSAICNSMNGEIIFK